MTSEPHELQTQHLRSDLAAVVIDGDIVVYDALQGGSHVLAGGAVAVWMALEDGGVPGVVERVSDAVGLEPDVLSDEIDSVLSTFRTLGFFDVPQPSDGPAHEPAVGG